MIRPLALLAAVALAFASPGAAHAQAMLSEGGINFAVPVTSLRDIPFRTVVRQQYDYSCGSAALATLLKYHYGVDVTEAEVFKAMYASATREQIRKVGFSLLDIKSYLAVRGLEADGYRASFDQLIQINRPAIAVVTSGAYRHFVVVKGARDGKILIGDPATGLKTYSDAEFAKIWNGIIFAIHPRAGSGAYNRTTEWDSFPSASTSALSEESLAQLTRGLPPLYQIATTRISP